MQPQSFTHLYIQSVSFEALMKVRGINTTPIVNSVVCVYNFRNVLCHFRNGSRGSFENGSCLHNVGANLKPQINSGP